MKYKTLGSSLLLVSLVAFALGAQVLPARADTEVLWDEAAANAECTLDYAGYGAPSGPDPLSPCQWDMTDINAAGAWDTATGAGVKVGVIDGGVDFTHPDLAGAIDVDLSCSFIYD